MLKTTEVRSDELSIMVAQIKAEVNGYDASKVAIKVEKLKAVKDAIRNLELAQHKQHQ